MKNVMNAAPALVLCTFIFPGISICQEMTFQEIEKELRVLKSRVDNLENELKRKDLEIENIKRGRIKGADMPHVSEAESESGLLGDLMGRVSTGGLIEVGAAHKATDYMDGSDDDVSDINLTTVEIGVNIAANDWINLETVFLYEDAFNDEESSIDLDVGTVFLGNPDKCPFYLVAGKMYVPFGALLTRLPDDPTVDQPMALMLGMTSEKALLVGYENAGFSASGYLFNGDMDKSVENKIDSFGYDINYASPEDSPMEFLVGASYISNIADSDGLTDLISENVNELADYVDGMATYMQFGFNGFFLDAEYMTALDEFEPAELSIENGSGAKPSIWNLEAGYNWNWGKNLEIVLKYAGSHETEALGFPEYRYGIGLNQEIFECVVGSIAFIKDEYHRGDADGRADAFTAVGQIAIAF